MKRAFAIHTVSAITLSFWLIASPAAAQTTRMPWSATGVYVKTINSGQTMALANGDNQIKNYVSLFHVKGSDPRVSGNATIRINANARSNGQGTAKGTFRLVPESGKGYWEGFVTAQSTPNGAISGKAIGRGHDAFQGMQISANLTEGVLQGDIVAPSQP